MEKIMNAYLHRPIFWDICMVVILWVSERYINIYPFKFADKATQMNVLANLIGTCVSLAGFILAALTIIMTFKSNIKSKGMNDATDALELIFSSKHYPKIVKVFKTAIVEYCVLFIVLYFSWMSIENFDVQTLNQINVSGIAISGFIVLRSLLTLFKVADLSERQLT
jgi:uncharacterized membrane protein (DUF485 family)